MRSPASAQDWAFVVWKYSVRRWPAPASGLAIWIFLLTWEIFRPESTPTPTSGFATHWESCSISRSISSLQRTSVTPISGSAWSRRRPCFMRLEGPKCLFDIQLAGDSIAAFCAGRSFEQYRADELLRAAVERKFGIIGEVLARLAKDDPEVAARIPEHPRIIAFRNIIVHGYASVDDRIVWGVIEADLPAPPAAGREMLGNTGGFLSGEDSIAILALRPSPPATACNPAQAAPRRSSRSESAP